MKFSKLGLVLTLIPLALALSPVAALAQQAAQTFPGLKLSGNDPVQIESDKLEVRQNENLAIFTGNVAVVQGTSLLKAGKLTVHYAKGKDGATSGQADIDKLEAEGKVYFASDKQIATGDKGTFDMKSEVLVLTGKPVVLSEGVNVAEGCKLTVQMKSGKALLDGCGGRVSMLLDPKSQKKN